MSKRNAIEALTAGLLSFVVSLIALGPALSKVKSAWGQGDMLATYVNVDNWGWIAYTQNNHYGYPLGIDTNLFPNIDITQNYLAKFLSLLTGSPFAGINLLLVASFPLIAVLAYFSIRLTGLKGPIAIALAIAFTMIPFHFGRGLGHTYLAAFYGAIAGVILAQLIGSGRMSRMLRRKNHTPRQFAFNIFAIMVLVILTAWSGVYYSVFGLILMATAWLWFLSQTKDRRNLTFAAIPILGTGLLSVAGFIPALTALGQDAPYASLGERTPFESVLFAGNLALAILPAPISQLSFLNFYNTNVAEAFSAAPKIESHALTNAGTWITFTALIFVCWAMLTKYRSQLGFLLTLTVVTVLFFVPWGFNYLFAAAITPQIRAWNRLVPVLLLLIILLAAAVIAQMKSAQKTGIAVSIAALIVIITIVESVWPFRVTYARDSDKGEITTQSAEEYVAKIDAVLPQSCGILQLPYMVYPENAPILKMNDYDHFWPALTGTQKNWSYGAVKYTQASAWMAALPEVPSAADMEILGLAGFCGIHLDTRAYVNPAADRIVAALTERYGPPQVSQRISDESERNDWLFFVTDGQAQVVDPATWSPDLTAWFNKPAITTDSTLENLTVAPRGSKDNLIWWWTIASKATFMIHQIENDVPLKTISGGVRIPPCANVDSAPITLTLDTGETLIIEANAKKTSPFSMQVKDPDAGARGTTTTLTVTSPIEGCKPLDFGYTQFAQVIDLTTNS